MILVDNSKKAGAVAHLVSLPSLECCPPQIQQVFDAQRQTQFCSFVDDVLHLWIGLGDEESMTLSHVKNAAAAMAKAMRRMKQTEYQVDCADVVKLFGIDSVYHLTTGIALGLYEYAGFTAVRNRRMNIPPIFRALRTPISRRFRRLSPNPWSLQTAP